MTMASSTIKPTARVSAMSERLSSEKPICFMTANVPMMAAGMARLDITVARAFLRNMNTTTTTRAMERAMVNFTSCTDSRMVSERSYMTSNSTD